MLAELGSLVLWHTKDHLTYPMAAKLGMLVNMRLLYLDKSVTQYLRVWWVLRTQVSTRSDQEHTGGYVRQGRISSSPRKAYSSLLQCKLVWYGETVFSS